MPLFFLHQRHGSVHVQDLDGDDYADAVAARREGVAAARQMMSETLSKHGYVNVDWAFEIRDEQGDIVDVVRFEDVIELRRSS